MSEPFQPNIHPDKGVPAADLGPGAPEPSPGFGIGGEEAGVPPDGEATGESADEASTLEDPPEFHREPNAFRPPDPDDVGDGS